MEKKLKATTEEYIDAIYFFKMYKAPRCWDTIEKAQYNYGKFKSESAKLDAVKEQIQIRFKGLGWENAHHAWSGGGVIYRADKLFKHLVEVVIPLAGELDEPSEPPLNIPSPPDMKDLGTTSDLALSFKGASTDKRTQLKDDCNDEIGRREARGDGDMLTETQESHMPDINDALIGYKIEMLFEYPSDDGSQYLDWAHGVVTGIVNEKTRRVEIEWDDECVAEGDYSTSKDVLFIRKWNPKKVEAGAWREYLIT